MSTRTANRDQLTETAADAAIEQACRILRLPTIRGRFDTIAATAARQQARDLYGAEYVPQSPRLYEKKVKNAQEAHEAIRPAGDRFRTPAQVAGELRGDEFALYELIWKRTVASQMADARGSTATVKLGGTLEDGRVVDGWWGRL